MLTNSIGTRKVSCITARNSGSARHHVARRCSARCTHGLDAEKIYAGFRRHGVAYGPSFRALRAIHHNASEAVATIAPPPSSETGRSDCVLDPFLLDAAFQTLAAFHDANAADRPIGIPYSLERMRIDAPLSSARFVCATANADARKQNGRTRMQRYDLFLLDDGGTVLAELRSVGNSPGGDYSNDDRALPPRLARGCSFRTVVSGRSGSDARMNMQTPNKREILALLRAGAITSMARLSDCAPIACWAARRMASSRPRTDCDFISRSGSLLLWSPRAIRHIRLPFCSSVLQSDFPAARISGSNCAAARYGDEFRQLGSDSYLVPPASSDGFDELMRCLKQADRLPTQVAVWLPEAAHDPLSVPLVSIFHLTKALQTSRRSHSCHVVIIAEGAARSGLPSRLWRRRLCGRFGG